MKKIYFDHAATTPLDRRVLKAMLPFMADGDLFGNASSVNHSFGTEAARHVENARRQVARTIQSASRDVVLTSGATEANNIAIFGSARAAGRRVPRRIISCRTEHKAVLDPLRSLEKEGIEVVLLPVNKAGAIDLQLLAAELSKGAMLASFMLVNNETGVVHPIEQIAKLCKRRGVPLHVDASQAIGKIKVDVKKLGATMLTLSAHKFGGPKGIGAMQVARTHKLAPLCFGGGQERGLRPGTLPVHQIVGMGMACSLANKELPKNRKAIAALHDRICRAAVAIEGCQINGALDSKVPHIVNLSFKGVHGSSLLAALSKKFALSNGSACTTARLEASHVLRAMGVTRNMASASLRISLGKDNTPKQVDQLCKSLAELVSKLAS